MQSADTTTQATASTGTAISLHDHVVVKCMYVHWRGGYTMGLPCLVVWRPVVVVAGRCIHIYKFLCVYVCVCARVRACVRACVCACACNMRLQGNEGVSGCPSLATYDGCNPCQDLINKRLNCVYAAHHITNTLELHTICDRWNAAQYEQRVAARLASPTVICKHKLRADLAHKINEYLM
eukprot:5612676-Amphidinium_carterae.1